MVLRGFEHVSLRLRQSLTLLENGPQVIAQTLLAGTRMGRPEITFQLRNGLAVVTSNTDGARFPIYEIFSDDAYELDELMAVLPDRPVVLDIGGQIGAFSLAVSARNEAATIHVYEASPFSAGFIRRNIDANQVGDRISLHDRAVAGRRGTIEFLDSGTASGHNGITAPDWVGATPIHVEADTFDDAVAKAGGSVHLVKLDVEGAEYDIILNSSPENWQSVRRVVMEYHPIDGHTVDELTTFFAAAGLVPTKHIPGGRPGLGLLWLSRDDTAAA